MTTIDEEYFKSRIRDIPDFPKEGVVFRDITTLLLEPEAFRKAVDTTYERCRAVGIDKVVGIESRGFIFGSILAYKLGCGFVPVRKPGKLPCETIRQEYVLEYGNGSVEVHVDGIVNGDRVLIVDDLIATGGTMKATCEMIERLGGKIALIAVLIELSFLKGQDLLKDYDYFTLMKYDSE